MANLPLIAIGGSAGALVALKRMVARFPADFPAAICVVIHVSPDSPGVIPEILTQSGPLRAEHAQDGAALEAGCIYVAPPSRHLVVTRTQTLLGSGPKENLFRPAIDPLFRSAGAAFGPDVAGIILSGGLDDGAAGLAAIKKQGGLALVQDPAEAPVQSMPRAAIRAVAVDHILSADRLADCALEFARGAARERRVAMATEPDAETRIARSELGIDPKNWGYPSLLTCPDCGGVLLQLKDEPLRFRCHTGHAFTAATLAATLREKSDDRLWTALRVLQEQKFLLQQGAPNDGDNDDRAAAMSVIEQAEQSLRRVILEVEIAPPETSAGGPAKKRPESR